MKESAKGRFFENNCTIKEYPRITISLIIILFKLFGFSFQVIGILLPPAREGSDRHINRQKYIATFRLTLAVPPNTKKKNSPIPWKSLL